MGKRSAVAAVAAQPPAQEEEELELFPEEGLPLSDDESTEALADSESENENEELDVAAGEFMQATEEAQRDRELARARGLEEEEDTGRHEMRWWPVSKLSATHYAPHQLQCLASKPCSLQAQCNQHHTMHRITCYIYCCTPA